jgi:hypothetical protein
VIGDRQRFANSTQEECDDRRENPSDLRTFAPLADVAKREASVLAP